MSWQTIEDATTPFWRAVLAVARDRNISDIGPTKMCGLLYLLDVEYYARYGRQATPVDWRWNNYGPFDQAAAYGPRTDSAVRESDHPWAGRTYALVIDQIDALDQRIASVLDEVFNEHGRKTGKVVKSYCYAKTTPMLKVQAEGSVGDRLDLTTVRPDPGPSTDNLDALEVLRSSLPEREPPSGPFDTDAFLATVEETRDMRERATSRMMGMEP